MRENIWYTVARTSDKECVGRVLFSIGSTELVFDNLIQFGNISISIVRAAVEADTVFSMRIRSHGGFYYVDIRSSREYASDPVFSVDQILNTLVALPFAQAGSGKQECIVSTDAYAPAPDGRTYVTLDTVQAITALKYFENGLAIGTMDRYWPLLFGEDGIYLGDKRVLVTTDIAGFVNGGSYNSATKYIELKHDNTTVASIDARAFIKDGMVDSVVVDNGYLVITFNTDSGKEPISISLGDVFDPANYYTKTDINTLLGNYVTLNTNQEITGEKYFSNALAIPLSAPSSPTAGRSYLYSGSGSYAEEPSGGGGGGGNVYPLTITKNGSSWLYYDPDERSVSVNLSVPTKVSDLANDTGFITSSALSGYATESWVLNKGYITSSALADYVTLATDQHNITGSKSFTNRVNLASAYITGYLSIPTAAPSVPLSGYTYLWSDTNGNYSELPSGGGAANVYDLTIRRGSVSVGPYNLGEQAADIDLASLFSGYATQSWVNTQIGNIDFSPYALKTQIPTKVSDLENDTGFITSSALSGYVNTIEQGDGNYVTGISKDGKKLVISRSTLPTKLSDFTDDVVSGNYLPIHGTADKALRLSGDAAHTAWGQTFWQNGVPKSISGSLTSVTNITGSGLITMPKAKFSSSLIIPHVAPSGTLESGETYLYAGTGEYAEEPSGGGVADIYDLTIRKNGSLIGTYNLGEQAANVNIPIGWADITDAPAFITAEALAGYATEQYVGNAISALGLGTASKRNVTDSVSQNNNNLPTSGAVYSAIAAAVTSALHYRGMSSTQLTDGGTEVAVIGGTSLVAQSGDVVIYGGFEFLWEEGHWNKLGDDSSYALKTVSISAGTGLTGGGDLTAARTISLNQSTIDSLALADSALQSSDMKALTLKVGSITVANNYNALTARKYTITKANITDTIGSTTYAPYNAAGYLPLSGGTLTGALIGTSATFASGKFTSSLSIPTSAPASVTAGEIYIYANEDGNYAETAGGGGTATVYDLTIRKNGTSLGTYNLGEQSADINIHIGWADLTPDASHRFLTDSLISTWNGKQDSISDLVTIRSNASHGNTAYGWGNHADAGYLTSFTETDPTVPGWAKASTKPSYTLDEVTDGSTRKLANYLPLTGGTISGTLGIVDSSDSKIILKSGDADNYNLIKFVANDDSVQGYLGTRGTTDLKWNNYVIYHTNNLSLSTLGGVPTTRKVNNKALSADITLSLDDVADGSTRKLSNYLPLTGGTLTGGLTLSNVDQTFDVSAATRSIYYKASDAVSYRGVMFGTNGDLTIGYDGPSHSKSLYLDGFNEYLRFGATKQYSVKLNSTGTVELSGISAVLPVTANEVNLGSSAKAFNNIYGKLDLSYVQSASDLKAIEALTGTGLAKRTADNTWELTDTADKADELVTSTEEDAMFTYRQVPSEAVGDVCKITAVKGKSVVWNQLLPIVSSYTQGGLSVTMDMNGHMVGGGTSTNGSVARFMNWYRDITAGHKYYFSFVGELSGIWLNPNCGTYGTPFSETVRSQILTATGTKMIIGKSAKVGNEMVIDGYLVCVDLTAAGLDDLTAAEFEALYPLPYYDYNAGELVNNAASGVEMLDAGGNSLGVIPLNITGLTSNGVEIFPDGMKSAGSVADEWSGTTVIKRIGVVDLGTLTYTRSSSGLFVVTYFAVNFNAKPNPSNYAPSNLLLPGYRAVGGSPINGSDPEKEVALHTSGILYINTAGQFTDISAFKAAMSGVYLYYELATPVTYSTDQPLPGTIAEFESGGTMRRLPVDTTSEVIAPMVCDFQYGANMSDVAKAYLPLSGGTVTGTLEAAGELIIPDSAPRNPDSTKVYLYCDTTGNYYQS